MLVRPLRPTVVADQGRRPVELLPFPNSRSVLGGVSVAIGLVVVAQVSVLAGLGGWMPLAAPTLWALSAGTAVTPVQLLLVVPFAAAAVLATAISWSRMQLDR